MSTTSPKAGRTHELAFLYDTPGPRARRRVRIATLLTVLALAAVVALALRELDQAGQLAADRWTPFLESGIAEYLLVGLRGTLLAAAVVAVLSLPIGALLAVARTSRSAAIRVPAVVYIELFRTVPVLLLIYVMLFALPSYGFNPDVLWKLTIPLVLANSAAFAEIVRAGILSLPRGQTEAGLSLGLRRSQVVRAVVLPQALRNVTPSLVSQLVSLLKDTSLGFVVAFTELLYRAQVLTSYNRLLIQTYLVVTLMYLIVNGSLSFLAARLRARADAPVPPPALATTGTTLMAGEQRG
ncbi:amino acid ABC transporter permease [Nocardioides campestrisoli]|uniref:amino acid ABC transporter permease n=1 Tax=Nocardioides campestrisoli TaxID=2736757 RepID=UPI0015E6A279|nr:amino acid ABC transporter permease [Nocardioides campestrisoli]